MFTAALFIITRSWKEPRCPSTEEWIQKMWYIYTMEYYSAIKKNEFMKFLGKWMDLEGIILSEVTQSQKNSHDSTNRYPVTGNGDRLFFSNKQHFRIPEKSIQQVLCLQQPGYPLNWRMALVPFPLDTPVLIFHFQYLYPLPIL